MLALFRPGKGECQLAKASLSHAPPCRSAPTTPNRRFRPIPERWLDSERVQVRQSIAQEYLGVLDCPVVNARSQLTKKVFQEGAGLQVTDIQVQFLAEVSPD